MTKQEISNRVAELAFELTPHSKFSASVLCALAASLLVDREQGLSALAADYVCGENKHIDTERLSRN